MTVTAVRKDPDRLTLTVEAEFDASVERIDRKSTRLNSSHT